MTFIIGNHDYNPVIASDGKTDRTGSTVTAFNHVKM